MAHISSPSLCMPLAIGPRSTPTLWSWPQVCVVCKVPPKRSAETRAIVGGVRVRRQRRLWVAARRCSVCDGGARFWNSIYEYIFDIFYIFVCMHVCFCTRFDFKYIYLFLLHASPVSLHSVHYLFFIFSFGFCGAFFSPRLSSLAPATQDLCTYFPPKTMWRTFFCAIVGCVTLGYLDPRQVSNLWSNRRRTCGS